MGICTYFELNLHIRIHIYWPILLPFLETIIVFTFGPFTFVQIFLLKKGTLCSSEKNCVIHLKNQRKADKSAELFEGPDNDTLRTPIGLSSKAAEKQIQQTLTWMAAVVTFFPAGNPQTTANWLQNWYLAASGWTVTFFRSILRVRCAIN